MPKPPSIDLGSVKIPARDKQALRAALSEFSDRELKNELLDRGNTDFSKLEPWIRNGLLLVIFAAACIGYWNMKCKDGIWSDGICTFLTNL